MAQQAKALDIKPNNQSLILRTHPHGGRREVMPPIIPNHPKLSDFYTCVRAHKNTHNVNKYKYNKNILKG